MGNAHLNCFATSDAEEPLEFPTTTKQRDVVGTSRFVGKHSTKASSHHLISNEGRLEVQPDGMALMLPVAGTGQTLVVFLGNSLENVAKTGLMVEVELRDEATGAVEEHTVESTDNEVSMDSLSVDDSHSTWAGSTELEVVRLGRLHLVEQMTVTLCNSQGRTCQISGSLSFRVNKP